MPNIPVLKKLEIFFKMPLKDIINKLHIGKQISLNELAKQSSVSRLSITNLAKKHNLKTRTVKEATMLTKNKGENHWAYGLNKKNSDTHKKHSDRMAKNNPSFKKNIRLKIAKTISKTFSKNPYPQEIIFRKILDKYSVEYIFQYALDRFVIDFFIKSIKLCIEVDSVSKWGKERRRKALIKDKALHRLGFNVLRIDKRLLSNESNIINILKANNVITNL